MKRALVSLLLALLILPTALSENRIKIDLKVNLGYNDAYEKNGKMYINGATIDMGKQSSTIYRGGFRFTNISLPKGAVIEDTRLSLSYNWASASKNNITLYGEASDSALQFKTTSKDISNRIKTLANIKWSDLGKVGRGVYQTSPNISSIIQEIINRTNWKEGNSIVILGYESSKSIWEAISYEGTSSNKGLYSAKLQITALIPSCTENWQCTDWSICSNGQQTRICTDLNNCGTINNKPSEIQDCVVDLCSGVICDDSIKVCQDGFTATCKNTCDSATGICSNCVPDCTGHECIENWMCANWSSCINNTQIRICIDLNECGTTKFKPIETQNCICNESWSCTNWSECINGNQTRICNDLNECGTTINKPTERQNCTILKYAGIRCTTASGIQSESSQYLRDATSFVSSKFLNVTPSVIYGPGYAEDNGNCYLNFPSPGGDYSNVSFANTDENEAHLDALDAIGAQIWLQVEPGYANVSTLIDLVLNKYKHHNIIGFGIDVEWLESPQYSEGRKVTDSEVIAWFNKIKQHNPNYKLFLKHWKPDKMPNNYPSDVVFIQDSELNPNYNIWFSDLANWGSTFSNSDVGFQVGYPSDKGWWDDYTDPVQYLGNALFNNMSNMKYYYWVDFSIKDVFPPTGDFCKSVICNDSKLVCPDSFVATCKNYCSDNTGICSNCIPNCEGHEGNRNIVMIVMDDLQKDWLEDVAIAITNINIEEGVDIVLNVIPQNIGTSTILSPKLKEWYNNYKDLIEIGEHGYTHDGNEYNMGSMGYDQQKTIITNGLNELQLIGINPLSFTPAGGDQNPTTLQVLGDMGFHTIFDCYIGGSSTPNVLALKQCSALLCDVYGVNGPSCNFKSSSVLMNNIDSMISSYGYAVVAFHMQDFSLKNGGLDTNKISKYRQLLKDLKNSSKYMFMTPDEYYQRYYPS